MPGIYVGTSPIKNIYVGTTPVKEVYVGTTKVRPTLPDYLCFTANTANSTVKLQKNGNPTAVTLETSTDGNTWSTYTIGNTITLSSVGYKVYFRNKSTTDTGFTVDDTNYYQFVMTGSIAASGDANYLINKNSTTTLFNFSYIYLFKNCTSLTSSPSLPATTLGAYCYWSMFEGCTNLTTIPALPATTLYNYCYRSMFSGCSNIKISTSYSGTYKNAYRIPKTGTGTTASGSLTYMFYNTGGTFSPTPSINTTYYTSNTVV